MFSFIKKYAETLVGIDIYPKISLVMFFLFFSALLWFTLRANKSYISEVERIPLDDEQPKQ